MTAGMMADRRYPARPIVGVGGFTPLFNAVVSPAAFWINHARGQSPPPAGARFAELLLARGADATVRASIRMRLGAGHGDTRVREFRDVTPLSWGRAFARQRIPAGTHREALFVNTAALRALEAHGARAE